MRKLLLLVLAGPLLAQDPLSLREAVRLALQENKAIAATNAGMRVSAARIDEARAGRLPKLNYSESFARSDNPVFVFGSLLTQHQFGVENFNIGPLNRPDSLNNFQSLLTVDQPLYDAGQTRNAVKSAGLSRQMTGEEQRRTQMQIIAGGRASLLRRGAGGGKPQDRGAGVGSAEADLNRAESMRAAGMSTDVDVLSIRVHLAAVTEQRIQRAADLEVAQGRHSTTRWGCLWTRPMLLTTRIDPLDLPDLALASLEREPPRAPGDPRNALGGGPGKTQADAARSALLPQVGFHAAFEADRQQFVDKGGANWLASVGLRWNLFNGLGDKARIEESSQWVERAHADEQRVDSAVRLEVRRAWADLRAARQRIEVAKAAVAEAEESLSITQNRYEAGMSNVTDLLRNETAVFESRTRYLAAMHDQRIAATMLELAAGRLSPDSEVLK